MKKLYTLPFIIFLLLPAGLSAEKPDYETWQVQFTTAEGKSVNLTCEVADSAYKQELGLMYREKLAENKGMIFVYKYPAVLRFWMKNTQIPLSIAFIDADRYITSIRDMEPQTRDITASYLQVKYAVEANQGWFEKNSIKAGSKVTFIKP